MNTLEHRLADFCNHCRARGFPLTPQRLAIFRAVLASVEHPTAEDIYQAIKPEMPSLSLGTVYRTLEWLAQERFILRVHAPDSPTRFDANRTPHHHLVCVSCHRVADIEDPALDHLPIAPERLQGFAVTGHHVQIFGVCPACQNR